MPNSIPDFTCSIKPRKASLEHGPVPLAHFSPLSPADGTKPGAQVGNALQLSTPLVPDRTYESGCRSVNVETLSEESVVSSSQQPRNQESVYRSALHAAIFPYITRAHKSRELVQACNCNKLLFVALDTSVPPITFTHHLKHSGESFASKNARLSNWW